MSRPAGEPVTDQSVPVRPRAAPAWAELAAAGRPFVLCDGVLAMFTRRWGGVSEGPFATFNLSGGVPDDPAAVAENRARLLAAIGPGPSRVAWMRQVHGSAVAYVSGGRANGPGDSPEVDAIFTGSAEVALGSMAADCVPVLVADPLTRLIGAAHAGRAGMASGVVPALLAAMSDAGAAPSRMHAIVGPSICGGCYEVPSWLQQEVAAVVPGSACRTRAGTTGLDLRAGVRGQLARSGLERVTEDQRCTAESGELFSYRRDGQTGRFAGVIWLAR